MLQKMRVFGLPSKPIKKLKELPQEAGVYYVTALWIVLYVGKAKNLRNRWRPSSHHRYQQFRLLHPFGRLHYKVLGLHQITRYEKSEIAKFRPVWNSTTMNPSLCDLIGLFVAVWGRVVIYGLILLMAIAMVIYLLWRSL